MGVTWLDPKVAVDHIKQVKDRTDKPFLVNFVLHFEATALDAVLREGVPIVTLSWGSPGQYREVASRAKDAGAMVGIQIPNLLAANLISDQADFLICQGVEAGGHVQSSTPLLDLVREIAPQTGLPVVAAGGISTGAQIQNILDAGASAAMLGTRFVATQESRAHPIYKQQLVEASATALTQCFDGGWPNALHRVLRNRTFIEWEAAGCPSKPVRPSEGLEIARNGQRAIHLYDDDAPQAGVEGDILAMCLYAGAAVGEIKDIPPAADLVARLLRELKS